MKIITSLIGLGVTLPIWYYLLYQILVRVQATELMMFLFWVYLPVSLVTHILIKIEDTKSNN